MWLTVLLVYSYTDYKLIAAEAFDRVKVEITPAEKMPFKFSNGTNIAINDSDYG